MTPHPSSPYRRARALGAYLATAAIVLVALALPATAMASVCGDKVLADWFDNGRIDRLYQAHCYEEAIDAIPADLRDYANAEEIISRALQASLRGELDPGGDDPTPGDDGGSTPPTTPPGGPPTDPGPRPRLTWTRPASRRFRSRSSCSAACRLHCSRPAVSATSRGGALRRTATTGLPAPTTS